MKNFNITNTQYITSPTERNNTDISIDVIHLYDKAWWGDDKKLVTKSFCGISNVIPGEQALRPPVEDQYLYYGNELCKDCLASPDYALWLLANSG